MDAITVTEATNIGSDILVIHGTHPNALDGNGDLLIGEARGWVSATQHYYPPSAYGVNEYGDRYLLPNQTPRAMTAQEKDSYCKDLLAQAFSALGVDLG